MAAELDPPLELRIEAGEQKYDDRRKFFETNLNPKHATVGVAHLEVADFGIVKKVVKADGSVEERLLALIERKTIGDLLASITDGRYYDQAERMVAAVTGKSNHFDNSACDADEKPIRPGQPMEREGALIYILLVGAVPVTGVDSLKIQSAIAHFSTYPHTKVVNAINQDQVLHFFKKTLEYLWERQSSPVFADVPLWQTSMENGRRVKLDNHKMVWIEQVNLVHGVGRLVARRITEKYPSQLALFRAYSERARKFKISPAALLPAAAAAEGGRKRKPAAAQTLSDFLDGMIAEEVELTDPGTPKPKFVGPAISKRVREVMFADDAEIAALGDMQI